MRRVITTLALAAVGCSYPLSTEGASRFTPPPVFATMWAEVQECVQRQGSYAAVTWFVVPAGQLVYDGRKVSGVWQAPNIYLTDVVLEYLDRYHGIVRHEMGHALGLGHGPLLTSCERGP